MLPDLPDTIHGEALRAVYLEPDPAQANVLGLDAVTQDEWDRTRKYAYARYWQARLTAGEPITRQHLQEWKRFTGLAFMGGVAWGIVGDAAKHDLLSPDQITGLLEGEPNDYAERTLKARRLLQQRTRLDQALIDALLDLRAAWALHDLIGACRTAGERSVLEQAAGDRRLSRNHRHHLAQALRLQPFSGPGS
ncbi:hypothetical protein [Spirillospora sp. NPDC047279]|uniref:hypothetical protein n=1 Tax=Spirillospora sp. NPDC047279 TaxID=3155478 RepID=UPI0033D09EB8